MGDRQLVFSESELPQGSVEWLKKRERTLGGSEVACLMGASPYKSAHRLWQMKTKQVRDDFTPSAAMERGTRLEPVARKWYEKQFGFPAEPICVEHRDNDFMVSSLDGISPDFQTVTEIKCPSSADTHRRYLANNQVPDFRYPQLQHQLMCVASVFDMFGSPKLKTHYVSYWWDEKAEPLPVVLEVLPDWEYISEMYRREVLFMKYVRNFIEPPSDAFPTVFAAGSTSQPAVIDGKINLLAAKSRALPSGGKLIYGDAALSFKRASKRPGAAARATAA